MRNRATCLLAALFAAALVVAHAEDPAAVRKVLQAQYDKQAQSLRKLDPKGVMAPVAANFAMKVGNGQTIGRQQIEMMLSMQLGQLSSVKQASTTITALSVKGSTAVATINQRLTATTKPAPDGKTHVVVQNSVEKDTWTKTAQGWKMTSMAPGKRSVTVDGKPMAPMGGGPRPK